MGNCYTKIKPNHQYFEMTEQENNNDNIQFTRYLYAKDEVILTLFISILNNKEESIFWAYELYYSGFIKEITTLFISMYYDFYASLNPSFEIYLQKNIPLLFTKTNDNEKLVSTIVHNFMIRSHTVDVFFMKIFAKELQFAFPFVTNYKITNDFTVIKNELISLLVIEDYLTIARLVFHEINTEHLVNTLETIIDFYNEEKELALKKKEILNKYAKKCNIDDNPFVRVILFSRYIHFANLEKKVKMGKNLYVHIEPEEVVMYETVNVDLAEKGNGQKTPILPAYKVLSVSTLYFIDEENYLSLFHLKRDKQNILQAYKDNWLFHSSYSPLWRERIIEHCGIIDTKKQTVEFANDDCEENFYQRYGYEPDEQKPDIQCKTIQQILHKRNWYDFYIQHKNRGLIDIDKLYFDNPPLKKVEPKYIFHL
jgi:hypothetical protein